MPGSDLDFAFRLASVADEVTTAHFRAPGLRVETKEDATPVSDGDRAAEEAIRALVASSGRGEAVVGEEYGGDDGDACWIVDPIDGTSNYVRGIPVWATLLCLERESRPVVAVVSAPALARRWWAVRGEGAFADGRRCRVSAVAEVESATVSVTSPRHMPDGWREIVRRSAAARGFGDFWQHCLVAEGAVEVACDRVLRRWDYAAVRLLVEEAGGRCSTFAGEEPADGASFLTSNGVLHDEAVSLLAG